MVEHLLTLGLIGTGFAHGKVDPHQAGKKGAEIRKAHMVGAH